VDHINDTNNIKNTKNGVECFYYEDMTPISIGDRVKISISNFTGTIDIIKGAWCISIDNEDIEPILFYNIYIHNGSIIKAFNKIK
jgi:hypothetical protein